MKPLDSSVDTHQVSWSQKIGHSSTTKAAIAAILLAGSSTIASADTTSYTSSGQSDSWNTPELLLEIGGTIALGALAYYATKRPRHGR